MSRVSESTLDRPSAHSTERVESSRPLTLSDSPLPRGLRMVDSPVRTGRLDLKAVEFDLKTVDSTAASARVALESRPWRALLRGRLRANGAS